MRFCRLLGLGLALALVLPTTPARAGLLEILVDDTSLKRHHCAHRPCKRNDLAYQTRYVKKRFLRYHAHQTPPQYRIIRQRIMVQPPTVAIYHEPARRTFHKGRHLLLATEKRVRVYQPAQYETVERLVLVKPAKVRVYRSAPYSAYQADTIVVRTDCRRGRRACSDFPEVAPGDPLNQVKGRP
jgi:hypothetical protein